MIYACLLSLNDAGGPAEGTREWIVGNPTVDVRTFTPASNEQLSFIRSYQAVVGAAWKKRKLFDRMQQGTDLMISTVRRFNSILECFRFRMGLGATEDSDKPHRMTGALVLRCVEGGEEGMAFLEFIGPQAMVLASAAVPMGVSLAVTYGVKCDSLEIYRSGLANVIITAQEGGIQAEAMLPFNEASADDWTVEIEITQLTGAPVLYTYTVDVSGGRPLIADAGWIMLRQLHALGVWAVWLPGEGLRVRSSQRGEATGVIITVRNDSLSVISLYSGVGTAPVGTAPVVDVNGETLAADLIQTDYE